MLDAEKIARCIAQHCPDCREDLDDLFSQLRHALAQRADRGESVEGAADETRSAGKTSLRIERRGIKLLDFDNGAGGCKALIDALRYQGLIVNDDPETIDFFFSQKKVKRTALGTLITITLP